jgi:hypothetical protein
MSKISGRLPMASSRRLSASINNKIQRPRSSYSLISGTNNEETVNNVSFNSTNMNTVSKYNNPNNQNTETSSKEGFTLFNNASKTNDIEMNLNSELNSCQSTKQQSLESKKNAGLLF